MPAAQRDVQLPGPVEQIVVDRRLRHQQLGQQLAARPDRDLTGPLGQVEKAPGGRGGAVQDQPGGDGEVTLDVGRDQVADRRLAHHDRHADLAGQAALQGPRGERRARRGSRAAVQPRLAVPPVTVTGVIRAEFDEGAERHADRGAQIVEASPGGLGGEHRVQPFLRPAQSALGARRRSPG